jgi:hypothetical protein
MIPQPSAMTVANDQAIIELISAARRRLVVVAPGLSKAVSQVVAVKWRELGPENVTVVLDVDPEVCRLGYGELEALKHLNQAASELGAMVNAHAGVRIGLIMADEQTLIYAPTPLLIEAGPSADSESPDPGALFPSPAPPMKPNAIRLGIPPAGVERDLGLGIDDGIDRVIGLDKADNARVASVEQDLAANPPQRFDISRSVRVFNSYFEFVEFELLNALVERKSVPLPKDLLGLTDATTRERLRMTFRLLDESSTLSGRRLLKIRNWIAQRYLVNVPQHGWVILRRLKEDFLKDVARLQRCVDCMNERVGKRIGKEIESHVAALVEALLPAVERVPPRRWLAPMHGFRQQGDCRAALEADVRDAFALALANQRPATIKVLFKAVTYESLIDPEFVRHVHERMPQMPALHVEYDAAKAIDPPLQPMKGAA